MPCTGEERMPLSWMILVGFIGPTGRARGHPRIDPSAALTDRSVIKVRHKLLLMMMHFVLGSIASPSLTLECLLLSPCNGWSWWSGLSASIPNYSLKCVPCRTKPRSSLTFRVSATPLHHPRCLRRRGHRCLCHGLLRRQVLLSSNQPNCVCLTLLPRIRVCSSVDCCTLICNCWSVHVSRSLFMCLHVL